MKKIKCLYCGTTKNVKVWLETDELTCLACRFEFLAREFDESLHLDNNSKIEIAAATDLLKPL